MNKPAAPRPLAGRTLGRSQVSTFEWRKNALHVLEQKDLPHKIRNVVCKTHAQAAQSIREMSVRGAPAIGCVAAYGIALAAREKKFRSWPDMQIHLEEARKTLAAARPTAVNLFWALERMKKRWTAEAASLNGGAPEGMPDALLDEAHKITDEDVMACRQMGQFGASLLPDAAVVLTHCNAGALATAGYGTALGVVRAAYSKGKIKKVLVDETRPYLQGARLTAWELAVEGIPYELITDNMAGHLMKTEKVSCVVVGADRIAANGDTANKIGTYSLAVLAKHHNIPFYVAAPKSTIDLKTPTGAQIPIEERSTREVVVVGKTMIAPKGAKARHPAFDVTPQEFIAAIVTESGIAKPPFLNTLAALFGTNQ